MSGKPQYEHAFAQDLAQRKADFQQKVAAVRQILQTKALDAVVLSYSHNFAWLTTGARNYINMAVDVGVGSLCVSQQSVYLLTNEIEGHRLLQEEMDGLQSEFQLHEDPWYNQTKAVEKAKALVQSDKIVVDAENAELETLLATLRVQLTAYEMDLYRSLGKDCGEIIGLVARTVRAGVTEWELAGQLSHQLYGKGITPVVLLIAADERADTIRHPLPTQKPVRNKVMLVLCGRRAGLIASVTRMVYVSNETNIPDDLVRRHEAATHVDAIAIASSCTSATVKACDIFQEIVKAYEAKGFSGEWKFHHQGGCAGYKSREWIANPTNETTVHGQSQAFAWNPTVAGTKSEDTVLVYRDASTGKMIYEVITQTPDWPMLDHIIGDRVIARPAILHVKP